MPCLEEGEQDSRTDSIPSVSETWRDSLVSRDARSSVDYVNRSPRTDSMFSLNEAQVDQYQRPTCTKPSAAHRALQVSVFWNTSPKKEPSTQSEPPEELSQRLSERIQMDILQAYGSTHSRPETPAQGFYEKGNLLDASAEKEMDAQRSANLRAASLTESEIKRNLSLYEPEFAALLETPEIMRNNRIESEESRMSKLRLSNDAQVFLDHVSDETDGLSSGETRMHMPTDQATDIYSHIPNDMQGLEMHRHVALAELLAIRDTTAPPGAFPGDSMPVQNRVALLLDSLVAHLDSVKQEYVDQLQNLLLMQNTVRQELGPMLEQHAMLQKQNQHMLQKANELAGCVMQLEASRARTEKPLPETHKGAGTFQVSPSLMPKPNVASLQLGSPETRPAPASEPPNSARLDASLPPLPSQRKFRWIKPLLLSNQDLTAIGNTLLQPAYDIGRTSPASLPPSPQRYDVTHTHPHDFQTTNILRPNARCCVCTRNVWAQTELRCTQCLLTCHVGCNDHVTSACEPNRPSAHQRSGSLGKTLMPLHEFTNPPQVESMIGRPLQDQVQREQNAVPRLIDRCLIAIERNGINEEGIYRRTGGINQQKQIVQLFDSGQQFDLCDIRQFNDTGAITSVVKFYLRELPEPLIPSELHDDFVEFGVQLESGSSFPAAPAMAALLGKLPVANRNTLQHENVGIELGVNFWAYIDAC
ncbi:Rho-type gtpase-activating protein [Malassezia vespertilionis]|uniref:Rho-type gtpase-activating protein n=1 Tax=Malassezia vespertilionis TaxID=2020962 RepID=UPI0024B0D469|nr:Rho-type gtpase-activating protein [Malassezia vespertilionis]WFD06585.1 Rho-type gtpase-activating protein [Malassezia vespertilionis]